jgi:rhodanese-related sulfurtransferase
VFQAHVTVAQPAAAMLSAHDQCSRKESEMQTIDTKQLESMMESKSDLAVINALPEESAREAHIQGTPNIPLERDDFVQQVESKAGGKNEPVVVYCANTECGVSEKAAKTLEEHGFEQVYDYEGGAKAWNEAHAKA